MGTRKFDGLAVCGGSRREDLDPYPLHGFGVSAKYASGAIWCLEITPSTGVDWHGFSRIILVAALAVGVIVKTNRSATLLAIRLTASVRGSPRRRGTRKMPVGLIATGLGVLATLVHDDSLYSRRPATSL